MSINYKGTRVGSLHTSILDPVVTQEPGSSEVLVMSQKAATASFANALKGRATGQVVTLDDVAPAPVNAKVRSKNLFNPSVLLTLSGCTEENGVYSFRGSTFYYAFRVTAKPLIDRTFFEEGKQYTISFDGKYESDEGNPSAGMHFLYEDGTWSKSAYIDSNTKKRYTLTSDAGKKIVGLHSDIGWDYNVEMSNIICCAGTETAYTPVIVDGTTVNVTTRGENLIPYPFKTGTTTINGVTFTDDGHGKIIVNGTATATVFYMLLDYGKNKDKVYAQDAVLAGCPSGGSINTYRLSCSNSQGASKSDIGKGVQLPARFAYRDVYIRIGNGCTVNNLVFEPRIVFATEAGETKTTFIGADIELDPIAPYMRISVDDVAAQLEVEYNRDPSIVIDKFTQAIISLGGNI